MEESFDPKYYSLGSIPGYRSQYIDIRINWFAESYGLKRSSWPLDCVSLLNVMAASDTIPFSYGFLRLPQKYDAITNYMNEHDVYITHINSNKIRYPFKYSSRDRRVNFTICHEIGHIVLGHLKVPGCLKTLLEIAREKAEADEFAARLLMPEGLLCRCNHYSRSRCGSTLSSG